MSLNTFSVGFSCVTCCFVSAAGLVAGFFTGAVALGLAGGVLEAVGVPGFLSPEGVVPAFDFGVVGLDVVDLAGADAGGLAADAVGLARADVVGLARADVVGLARADVPVDLLAAPVDLVAPPAVGFFDGIPVDEPDLLGVEGLGRAVVVLLPNICVNYVPVHVLN